MKRTVILLLLMFMPISVLAVYDSFVPKQSTALAEQVCNGYTYVDAMHKTIEKMFPGYKVTFDQSPAKLVDYDESVDQYICQTLFTTVRNDEVNYAIDNRTATYVIDLDGEVHVRCD